MTNLSGSQFSLYVIVLSFLHHYEAPVCQVSFGASGFYVGSKDKSSGITEYYKKINEFMLSTVR